MQRNQWMLGRGLKEMSKTRKIIILLISVVKDRVSTIRWLHQLNKHEQPLRLLPTSLIMCEIKMAYPFPHSVVQVAKFKANTNKESLCTLIIRLASSIFKMAQLPNS
jgi:hypothetical protein